MPSIIVRRRFHFDVHPIRVLALLVISYTSATLSGQWNTQTAGQMSTGNYVALGPNAVPVQYTSLRLSVPAGDPSAPCTSPQPELWKCLQLGFGTSSSMLFGFRLDGNNLQLVRSDSTWKTGMTIAKSGDVAINAGTKPLRIDAVDTGGAGAEFRSLHPIYPNAMALVMEGQSFIAVSKLQLGNLGEAVVRSNAAVPLYLNKAANYDVIVGEPHLANMGLRVEGTGASTFRGAVGIGTTTPAAGRILDVVGNAHFQGTLTGTVIEAQFQDLAEWVPSLTRLAPATVVVLDAARENHVTPSTHAYDTAVAGVVSAQPGIALGEASESKTLIATTGRVLVRVDASREPIAIGDLLVTGDKPGVAMKSMPITVQGMSLHRPGTVVGKALQPLAAGEGEILVLLSLQ